MSGRREPPPLTLAESTEDVRYVPSGSCLLDLVLGGGWARGRIANIVGDRSAGKTLCAIEAAANFSKVVKNITDIRYAEAEAAFDVEYAKTLGFPNGIEPVTNIHTVEAFHDDLLQFVQKRVDVPYSLYVLDSLDSLSDEAELARDIDKDSYGGAKAKKLSEMFRRLVVQIEASSCTLFVISQIRDKMNAVPFGETKTRSGGKALDFYCSQIIWLTEIGKIKRTHKGIDRVVGVNVAVKNKKNKVGLPFRECSFPIIFGYGIDDDQSMLDWIKKYNVLEKPAIDSTTKELNTMRDARDRAGLKQLNTQLRSIVIERWQETELALQPVITKY